MSHRTRAGLAAAVLAVASGPAVGLPSASLAGEPVKEEVGDSPEESGGLDGGEPDREPILDAGPDAPDAIYEQDLPGTDEGSPDDSSGPEEEESLGTPEPGGSGPIPNAPPVPTAPGPPPSVPKETAPADEEAQEEEIPGGTNRPVKKKGDRGPKNRQSQAERQAGSANPAPDYMAQGPATGVPDATHGANDSRPSGPPSGASPSTSTPAADDAGTIHIVEAGETLWSIARARLGPGASNAEVAREVNRLWRLNSDRIGTGTPDLIRPGQRLRLG